MIYWNKQTLPYILRQGNIQQQPRILSDDVFGAVVIYRFYQAKDITIFHYGEWKLPSQDLAQLVVQILVLGCKLLLDSFLGCLHRQV